MALFITLGLLSLALIGLNKRLRAVHYAIIAAAVVSMAALFFAANADEL